MLPFRLNIALSHFNRVNRFFKRKLKSTVCAEKKKISSLSWSVKALLYLGVGGEAGQKFLL